MTAVPMVPVRVAGRGGALALLCAAALAVGGASFAAPPSEPGLGLAGPLAEEGEAALARGDADAATHAFDRAAGLVHAPEIEIGVVRSHMQAGRYRQALAFAAHAAGAHQEAPAGTALYAWLLHIGGQAAVARRTLDAALAQWPGDAALQTAQAQLASARPRPVGVLLVPPWRAAPYPVPAVPAVAAGARVVGSAVLLGDGRRAVMPAATLPASGRVWLRNGLGQTVSAEAAPLTADTGDTGWVLLRLAAPLPAAPGLLAPAREPFAGSPAYTIEYEADDDAAAEIGERGQAAWPLLTPGFFGRTLAAPNARLLGIALAPGPRGGPVFDAFGRLAGLAVPGADGRDRLLPLDAAASAAGSPLRAAAPGTAAAPADRVGVDALYEVGMRVALQVLASP